MSVNPLKTLWSLAFGDTDAVIDCFFSTAYAADRCRFLEEGDTVAAALYWLDGELEGRKYAYIYGVATHPEHRGKGLCRKLMADVHILLKQLGYDSVLLVPAEKGLWEMYRKMGYEDCTAISEITCTAADVSTEIRSVSPEEYADLRRSMLPEGGVLQERNNLTFLAAQTQLFAGTDFLLAAWLEGNTLHGVELLGNTNAAPEILLALGCEKGIFQIPGTNQPFSMIHKLHPAAVVPKYFGFSFD